MKKILSTALAIILFVGASQAQSPGRGRDRQHGNHEEMGKELNLSADQKEKLKTIHEAERNEIQELKADGKTEADKTARKQIHEKYKMQLESVLTEEQKAKFKNSGKESKGDEVNKNNRNGKGREAAQELNLTGDQKTKVAALNAEFKTKMEAVRNNSSLSKEEKRTQTKTIAEEHRTNLKAILTPEQAAKMASLRKGHHKKDRNEML